MAQRGDKFYRTWNGTMEVATLIEENIAEGASIPTYVMRSEVGGKRFRCSKDMYFPTERAAWTAYLQEIENAIPQIEQQIERLKGDVAAHKRECERVAALLLLC